MSTLIVIGGPTASGKTTLAIELARRFGTVILSADSRQFYRELNIGVARPDASELAAATHYFVADRSVTTPLSAGTYATEALQLLDRLFQQHESVVMVGGSGLYIDAVTEGLDDFPEIPPEIKEKVKRLFEAEGLSGLQNAVAEVDPDHYRVVDRQNPRRLQRALEVSLAAGRPYSTHKKEKAERPFHSVFLQPDWRDDPNDQPPYGRKALYDRINRRVDRMMEQGLAEEARGMLKYRHLAALQTVGYQEFWPHFAGEYDLDTAVELIKRNSRRYAKRQVSWFGRGEKYSFYSQDNDTITF